MTVTPVYAHMANAQFGGFFLALIFTLLLVPIVRRKALAGGYVDNPGERKIHTTPTPRIGGMAIWMGFLMAFVMMVVLFAHYPAEAGISGVLIGASMMFMLGLADDFYNLSPYIKLAVQILAAVTAFYFGVQIQTLDLPGGKVLFLYGLSFPVTVLWLVGLSNAINFIDGVDGLAGGVTTIAAMTLALIAVFTNQPIAGLLAALLAGSSMGFLVYNFYPAKIFMG
nr:undecaprenyl/decaprenyl-phosphate alpha-N-acetylglucosaminyl 1-phosphate transferase [Vampirovibrio sp.]